MCFYFGRNRGKWEDRREKTQERRSGYGESDLKQYSPCRLVLSSILTCSKRRSTSIPISRSKPSSKPPYVPILTNTSILEQTRISALVNQLSLSERNTTSTKQILIQMRFGAMSAIEILSVLRSALNEFVLSTRHQHHFRSHSSTAQPQCDETVIDGAIDGCDWISCLA